MKHLIKKSLALALICGLGTPAVTPSTAHAGILFMTTGTVVGFALGFGMIIGGSARRIFPIILLDHSPQSSDISNALSVRYPELDPSLNQELTQMIAVKAAMVSEVDGIKEVKLDEAELKPVLDVLNITNPELGQKIVQDFN